MRGAAECTARWDGGEWYCSIHIDKRIKVEKSELILSCLYVLYMVSFFAYLSSIGIRHDIFQTNNTQEAENLCRNQLQLQHLQSCDKSGKLGLHKSMQ